VTITPHFIGFRQVLGTKPTLPLPFTSSILPEKLRISKENYKINRENIKINAKINEIMAFSMTFLFDNGIFVLPLVNK